MLPDLPALKKDLTQLMTQYVQLQTHHHLGVFNQAPTHLIHEGERMRMIRADGTEDESDMKEASSEFVINKSEIATFTPDQRMGVLDQMALQMADQMSHHLFVTLGETLEKAGQTFSAKGRKLDGEAVLDALERVQTDFDEVGNPSEFTLVVGPALHEQAQAAFREIEDNPKLSARRNEIYERKRLAWRDREANRKLVG